MHLSSINFLEANRHHYDLLVRAGYVKHLDAATRQGLVDVIRLEFDPRYIGSTWCSECVANTLKLAYQCYDNWKAENKNILPIG